MTLDFETFKERVSSRKIFLAEIWVGVHLQDFDKTSGYSYVYELPVVMIPELNHLPIFQEILENNSAYSAQTSIANVEANAGSYYYDKTNRKVYIHTTGGDDPDGTTGGNYDYTIVANFWLRFGSEGKIFNAHYYYPRIAENGLSDLTVSSRTIFFGIQTTGNGSLKVINVDRFFDKTLKQYIWTNRAITILLGGDDMEYADYATVFKGTILDWQGADDYVTFTIKDYRSLLSNDIPPNVYEQETYPDLSDDDVDKPIPIAYGYITSAPTIKVGTTGKGIYKICNHDIHQIVKVYNDGVNISTSVITKDLANGEFTIASGYSGTPGTITADIIGKPLSENEPIIDDDFSDNDISEYDEYKSGGTATWTASGGIVSGSIGSGYAAFLIHPLKRFSSGEITIKVRPNVSAGDYRIGLVWDFVDYSNFKALVIAMTSPQRIRLYSVASGTWTQLTNDSITAVSGNWYELKLVLTKDGLATPYLDGAAKTAYAYSLGSYQNGFLPRMIGPVIYNGMSGDFDDFFAETDYVCFGAQIVRDICVNWLDIDENDIDEVSFASAIINAPQFLAVYLGSEKEAQEYIEQICHSNLCRFVIGENGKVHYLFWSDEDESQETIRPEEILGSYVAEEKESEVFEKCLVKYGQGSGTQWKIKTWGDPRVAYLYKRGITKEFETFLTIDDDAANLAYQLFQLLQMPVTRYKLKAKMKCLNAKIGDVITIQRRRGISASGKHNTEMRIVGLTKYISRTEVQIEAVSNSQALGSALCEVSCQQPCEISCQLTCELQCQEVCELYCEGECQAVCQKYCELHCQTECETSGCEVSCMGGCQDNCTEGIICQETCQLACQSACQLACTDCQAYCTARCELLCQVAGEIQ